MGKYIVLTKDTAPLVLQRLKKMQAVTGKLTMNHTYTGQQKIAGYMSNVLRKRDCYPLIPVIRANSSIINQHDCMIEVDNDKYMQVIRMNWDKSRSHEYHSDAVISYGTKIYISSEKIQYKEKTPSKIGMITTITK